MPPRTFLSCAISSLLCLSCCAKAETFNTQFLAGSAAQSDLSRVYQGNSLLPGDYSLDIYVNEEWKGRFAVDVRDSERDLRLKKKDFLRLGIKPQVLSKSRAGKINLATLNPMIRAHLDAGRLALNMTVPQATLDSKWRDYVDPAFWDRGVNGAMLSWQANYYRSALRHGQSEGNGYASFNSGIKLFGWQLRDSSSYSYSRRGQAHWNNNTRYIQRGLARVDGLLRVGESYTRSGLFDSIRFCGMSLASDIRMLPDAMQGFAPIVRGMAQTNALVTVRQNEVIIWQQNVAPGAFAIDDILPTGSGGDLQVEIAEADGRSQRFIVPFSSVPNMLKAGVWQYDVTAGEAQVTGLGQHPGFAQGTLQYGFSNLITGYSGTILSPHYQSMLAGAGLNLALGALSLDVTHASTRQRNGRRSEGESVKLGYSKYVQQSGTSFSLAAYRYSTQGYYTFEEAIQRYDAKNMPWSPERGHQKNSFNLNFSQRLGADAGALYVTGTLRDYWGSTRQAREYQMGYSNSLGRVNYSLALSRTRDGWGEHETRLSVGLSIPLSVGNMPAWLTANAAFEKRRYSDSNIGVSGTAGDSNRWSYNANFTHRRQGHATASLNTSYKASASTFSGSWSQSSEYQQAGIGLSGSLVAWRDGVLLANQAGDTFNIVDAPGASYAAINNDGTDRTNADGKGLVSSLSPYRKNAIVLDTSTLEGDIALDSNRKEVVPWAGAITLTRFTVDRRHSFIFRAALANGRPLPFGTEITDSRARTLGYVGQGSLVFVRSNSAPSRVLVHIAGNSNHACAIDRPVITLKAGINRCF